MLATNQVPSCEISKGTSEETLAQKGELYLHFKNVRGKTSLVEYYQRPPLRTSHVMYLENSHTATIYLVETAGGILAGDGHEYRIKLEENTSVVCNLQSATKIYPSMNKKWSQQGLELSLEEDAVLLWKPETIIPYEQARFNSEINIKMKASSTLLWGEILSPGREKKGEIFQYKQVKTKFQVWINGEFVVFDVMDIKPQDVALRKIGYFEEYPYMGSLWFFSPCISEINVQEYHEKLHRDATIKAGITEIEGKGIHVRWLSSDICLLKKEMMKLWEMWKIPYDSKFKKV